jgi:tRNA-dihydrouridine synthase B
MQGLPKMILAPMAGITDAVFRQICFEKGCRMAVTEMVSAKGLYYENPGTEILLETDPQKEGSVGIQLFGSEPEIMAWAAKKLEERSNAFIDINMGCPVPKVFKNGEGSALLKDPNLAAEIVSAVKTNTAKPVTAKMRTGISSADGCEAFARVLEAAGLDALIVHARTKEQYYSGKADWSRIKSIKEAVGIPVIGNGDVRSKQDAQRMIEETGCDAVMVARGAIGNPWIFADYEPAKEEILETINRHLDLAVMRYGESRAVREARKQIGRYIKGIKGASSFRNRINTAVTREELRDILKEI